MQERRVVDIYIPKKKEEKPVSTPKEEERVEREKPKIHFSVPSLKGKGIKIGSAFLLLAVFIFLFFYLPKAKISIWPETESVDLSFTVTVDEEANEANLTDKVIPGEILEVEKSVSEDFTATGKATKEGKAEGIITVYNEYSIQPQVFIATTRFISAEGKLFRTPTKVVVPGGKQEGGKLVAGQIDIKVIADEVGPEYNIGPSTFSIPGFAGTDRYTKFYAKSFQTMTGGFLSGASLVTKDDLEEAETSLTKKAKEAAEASLLANLQSEARSAFAFLDSAIQTEVTDNFTLATVGQETNNFNYQSKAVSKTMVFREIDLENFVKEYILSKDSEGKEVWLESLRIDYTPETINLTSGKMVLSLNVTAKTYQGVDISRLKEVVSGKSLTAGKIFLENQAGITKAEVELWPFWAKRAPRDLEKIEIGLKID